MTTPKRNEAVAWAVVVDGTPDYASVHKYACDSEAGVYGIGPTVSVEPLYSHEQMDALQVEVSRLREDAEMFRWLTRYPNLYTVADLLKADQYVTLRRACEALMPTDQDNLEPPTDGR